jgi:vacuolar-type H+-ATPase subunit I/STV1
MNIRQLASILLLAVVIFSTNVIAKNIAIYRWIDENNVVHFSQHLPTDDNYSQLTTVSSYNAKTKQQHERTNSMPPVNEQITRHEKELAEIQAKNKEITANNCKAAQLNMKMLNSFNQIMTTDDDGKNRLLTDKEKKSQLELSKKHITLYCKKSD